MRWIAYTIVAVLLVIYAVIQVLRIRRRIADAKDPARKLSRCGHCGYILRGLDIPRCPECGRARGFERTFEEMGISEDDVREHIRTRSAALHDKSINKG